MCAFWNFVWVVGFLIPVAPPPSEANKKSYSLLVIRFYFHLEASKITQGFNIYHLEEIRQVFFGCRSEEKTDISPRTFQPINKSWVFAKYLFEQF